MRKIFFFIFISLALHMAPAWAATMQNHAEIRNIISNFVQSQTRALPGKTTFEVSEIDRRLTLPACAKPEAFLAPGVQLNGHTNVGIRCSGSKGWTIYVPVTIKTSINLLILKRTLVAGQTITSEDLGTLSSESIPAGTLTDLAQAVGKIMKYGVGSGQILRYDMIRAPYTVKQGQTVQIKIKGKGFSVSNEGKALANAAEGETVSARTASGQIISGIASQGAIEINQ